MDSALARARSGDEAGFVELWRQLQPPLLRYLRVLSPDEAEDAASETWLQVVRDLHNFTGGTEDFRRWLFTVARHRAIDAARARARRPAAPLPGGGFDHLPDSALVEDQVLDGLSVRGAIALVARLSPDQAEVVALRVIAGLDTGAVAGILGKSSGAVRIALHRGLRALAADPAVRSMAPVAGPRPAAPPASAPPAGAPGAPGGGSGDAGVTAELTLRVTGKEGL